MDAVDLSTKVMQVAKINIAKYAVEYQLTLYHSDLLTALPTRKYDLIICNLPYVASSE